MIEPVVNRVVAAHSDVALRKVNIADSAELATRMDVRGLPTLVFVANDGRELARLSGVMTGNRIECALSEARAGLLQL
jgi:thioredoxin-like negative regulator of GroEL